MGFYGNITNTARTQFQFDKIYPNRYEMTQKTNTDGVYAGRYCLIEYDSEVHTDTMKRVWIFDNQYYTVNKKDATALLTKGTTAEGTVVFTAETNDVPANNIYNINICKFYVCTSKFVSNSNEPAEFKIIANGLDAPAYTINYNIDTEAFKISRGYDSTVWQKVYTDGNEKYVMIAELNTVVPKFDVSPDAPTMSPIVPHFDTQSTDVYYKLHWQAPWGFRIKEADASQSDETTIYTVTTYDPETGINTTSTTNNIPAAIYYNDAGFAAQVDVNRTSAEGINKHSTTVTTDEIKVEPTGKSGNKYNDHEGQLTQSEQVDIQEMTINLPSIGNMMSDAWDIIHGPRRNDDMRETDPETGDYVASLKGRLDSIDAIAGDEIPVKRHDNGQLIGSKVNGGKADEDDKTGINDDAWIETIVDAATNTISIHHKFNRTKNGNTFIDLREAENWGHDTTDSINMNNAADNFDIVTPIIDDMGHVVGENTQTITLPYNFKTIKTNGVSAATNNPLVTENVDIVADNSKDDLTIAAGNKWIRMANNPNDDTLTIGHEVHAFTTTSNGTTNLNAEDGAIDENNINIPDWNYDEAGHIKSKQDHYYTLPYSFKTITVTSESAETDGVTAAAGSVVAENTQDTLTLSPGNKWIHLTSDTNNDTITVSHEVNSITTTEVADTDLTTDTSASVTIPDWTYDEGGHIRSKQNHLYKLPFGYAQIKGDNNTSTAATTTYDELSIVTGDDWLTSSVSADTVTITHDFKAVTDTASTVDKNTVTEDKDIIKLYTPIVDNKGHVVGKNLETVTLPFGYKTFTGDSGTTSANNTQDSMSIIGDSWVQTTASDDKITFAHIGPVSGTAAEVSAETPAFGATFNIDDHYFDDKGHKFTSKSHTVKIPLPSLANGIGNVVTGLSLVPTTGALTETKADLGTIKLGTYEGGDNSDNLTADITLQQALSRLQNKIANEATNRRTAIEALNTVYATTEQGVKADSALQLNTPIVYNDTTKTVEELLKMVIDLQAQVTALEAKVNENHPVENTETIE